MRRKDTAEVAASARRAFDRALADLQAVLARLGDDHVGAVAALACDVVAAWRHDGKLLICGNGGSAADSQHIAAELVGRFHRERPGYPAIALTTNTSTLTAVGNDYGFDNIFARQVQAVGTGRDVLLVVSTSGRSVNCVRAVEAAREAGMRIHGFLGRDGGPLLPLLDGALVAPSDQTPHIQEIHITMGHVLCDVLEHLMAADPELGAG